MGKLDISETISKMIKNIGRKRVRDEIANEILQIAILARPDEFKKLLEEFLKYPEGIETAKEKWRNIYNNAKDSTDIIATLGSINEVREEMVNDVPYLLKYGSYKDSTELAREVSQFEGGNEAISQNADEFIRLCVRNADFLATPLFQTEEGRKKLKENFEFFKKTYSIDRNMPGFFRLIRGMKDAPEFQSEYEEYSYWADLYDEIKLPTPVKFKSPSDIFNLSQDEQRRVVRDREAPRVKNLVFSNLIESEDREEKKIILEHIRNGNKFEYKNIGTSSFIIQAGDQIIKLGLGRRKYEIPYHPRIMMPYFRKRYNDGSVMEIFNLGVTDPAKITDQKLLEIYKELEDAGIRWEDAKKENLLVLTKDNEIPDFVQSEDFNLFGFLKDERFPTKKHKALKKGDIVICDLDMLYTLDEQTYLSGDPDYIISRYLMLKKNKNGHEEPDEH